MQTVERFAMRTYGHTTTQCLETRKLAVSVIPSMVADTR